MTREAAVNLLINDAMYEYKNTTSNKEFQDTWQDVLKGLAIRYEEYDNEDLASELRLEGLLEDKEVVQ
jgi:hypothetical protein